MEFRNRHVVTRSRLAASGDACLLSCVGACSLGVPPFWVCVCVCVSYLTSGVMCSAEGRHATEPGTDYKTGRAELPTPILSVQIPGPSYDSTDCRPNSFPVRIHHCRSSPPQENPKTQRQNRKTVATPGWAKAQVQSVAEATPASVF